ncbi:MAG: ATP-binding cassette domain-containing protein, partial [Ferruginibacter sp.]
MITVNNLKKSYKGVDAVDIDHLEINSGEVIGLVGNNGAGKTTFFRLLLDLIRSNEGEVLSKGKSVTATEDWKSYTAAYIDEGFLIDYLTPEEYFYFVGKLHQKSKPDVDDFLQSYTSFFDDAILGKGKYIRDF